MDEDRYEFERAARRALDRLEPSEPKNGLAEWYEDQAEDMAQRALSAGDPRVLDALRDEAQRRARRLRDAETAF